MARPWLTACPQSCSRLGGWTEDVPRTQHFYASLIKINWFSCFCVSSSCFCAASAALSSPAYEMLVFPTATVMQSSRGGGSSEEEHRNPLRQQEMPGQMGARPPSEPSRHCATVNYHSSCSQVLLSSLLLEPTPQGPSEVSSPQLLSCVWDRSFANSPATGQCSLTNPPLTASLCQSQVRGAEAGGCFQIWDTVTQKLPGAAGMKGGCAGSPSLEGACVDGCGCAWGS